MNIKKGSLLDARALGVALLVTLAVALFQPDGAEAQNVTGSGTINKVPKWTGTSALGDSTIFDNGNIGIGTTGPNRLLHIRDTANGVFTGARVSVPYDGSDPVYELLHETANKGFRWRLGNGISSDLYLDYTTDGFASYPLPIYMTVLNSGNVGIGTTIPARKLEVVTTSEDGIRITAGNGGASRLDFYAANGIGNPSRNWTLRPDIFYWGDFGIFQSTATDGDPVFAGAPRLYIHPSGNVGIGTTLPSAKLHVMGTATISGDVATGNINANGNISATGVINAKYQDLAEWVPSRSELPPGTVVVIDPDRSNHVLASLRAYDTRVAGVISARPGVVLGEGGEGKVMVATTGRVRVKVDATNAPIRVGDLLVTSDKEGIAMRSQPLDLGGTPIHRPGTLIGKALEPLIKGVGEILVLLSLQ